MSELIAIQVQRSIGGLYADVTIEEESTDKTEITRHPVEQGAAITDHAYNLQAEVTISAGVSNSSFAAFGNLTYSIDFYQALLNLKTSLQPFMIVTGKRVYNNMLIETLTVVTNLETEEALLFRVTCRELLIAQTQTTSVPPTANQSLPQQTGATQNTGSQQLTPATTFNPSDAYANG